MGCPVRDGDVDGRDMSGTVLILFFGLLGLFIAGPIGAIIAIILTYFLNKILQEN